MSHKFTSLELYELIWSEPLRKLGQRMGISDVAIAKHCRKASIPLPGVGYWERSAVLWCPVIRSPETETAETTRVKRRDRYGAGWHKGLVARGRQQAHS